MRSIFATILLALLLAAGAHAGAAPAPAASTNAPPAVTQARPAHAPPTAEALAPHVRAGTPLRIRYDGAGRVIHPYRLGANPRTGRLLLRAWEESRDGRPTGGFRTYAVAKIGAPAPIPDRGPIALPPRAYAPDKTIPVPIAQRTPPSAKGDK